MNEEFIYPDDIPVNSINYLYRQIKFQDDDEINRHRRDAKNSVVDRLEKITMGNDCLGKKISDKDSRWKYKDLLEYLKKNNGWFGPNENTVCFKDLIELLDDFFTEHQTKIINLLQKLKNIPNDPEKFIINEKYISSNPITTTAVVQPVPPLANASVLGYVKDPQVAASAAGGSMSKKTKKKFRKKYSRRKKQNTKGSKKRKSIRKRSVL